MGLLFHSLDSPLHSQFSKTAVYSQWLVQWTSQRTGYQNGIACESNKTETAHFLGHARASVSAVNRQILHSFLVSNCQSVLEGNKRVGRE